MSILSSVGKLVSSIESVIDTITNGSLLGKFGICAGAVLTAYFTPIVGLLVTCFALTTVDMCYGLAVAKKQRQKITSDKNWHGTITKLLHSFVLICLGRLIEFTVMGSEGVFILTGGITVIISLTELWSILENLNTLYPKGPWKALAIFLKKKGEDYTGVELDLNNNEHTDDSNVAKESL